MKRIEPEILDYYNGAVVPMIIEKYGYSQMDALRAFLLSKTHEMLEDEAYGLTSFGAGGIFDLWEADQVTGDPRNSIYIRGE